jgi:hypothetical protein
MATLIPNNMPPADGKENFAQQVVDEFSFGFSDWLVKKMPSNVLDRLSTIEQEPLGRAQLNQLLHLCHEAGVSQGFFDYYWLSTPRHLYEVTQFDKFDAKWKSAKAIISLDHLKWGLYRLYVDCLLCFGDVRTGFQSLRVKSKEGLVSFFEQKSWTTQALIDRGPALKLVQIAKDDRYLISEMACKSHAIGPAGSSDLKQFLTEAFKSHSQNGGGRITIRKLFEKGQSKKSQDRQTEFLFSADAILDDEIETAEQLEQRYAPVFQKFERARQAATKNTEYFLSMANDLDIYVATSMRDREDFRKMADFCETIFRNSALEHLNLRYFDPTMSAAEGHEDKGLIECLMVKSAKVLVYVAGKKDSFGKDAEAAMALSLGKPVIFYCDEDHRGRFFSEVHPLSRLIDFETGVAVGAMVTSKEEDVVELLLRIFENRMKYHLEATPSGLKLREQITNSVVRLQTRNALLRETFWNYYHRKV